MTKRETELRELSSRLRMGNYDEHDLDILREECDNIYDKGISITIFGHEIEVESLWKDKYNELYLHVGCPEFEGDLRFVSLPDEEMSKFVLGLV